MPTVSRHACHEFYQPGDPSMYRNKRREGHGSVGASWLSRDYYLSEGSPAWGFTSYVLVQNPNSNSANVTPTYMTPGGPKAFGPVPMPPFSRKTVKVNDVSGMGNTDFSTQVHADQPVMAERSMYWKNQGAGADTIGGNGD